jgi:hypothetical protein
MEVSDSIGGMGWKNLFLFLDDFKSERQKKWKILFYLVLHKVCVNLCMGVI